MSRFAAALAGFRAEFAAIEPGFADPRDFIRPDGSYDVTPINVDPDGADKARDWIKQRNRDATPCAIPYPNREGVEK